MQSSSYSLENIRKDFPVLARKVRDEKDWSNQHQWLLEKLVLFKKGFGSHLPDLIDD